MTLRKIMTMVLAGIILAVNMGMPSRFARPIFYAGQHWPKRYPQTAVFQRRSYRYRSGFQGQLRHLWIQMQNVSLQMVFSMSAVNFTASRYMKLLAHIPILLVDNPRRYFGRMFWHWANHRSRG